ncbi:translation elongation factor Ts [Dichotomicrobium thermohalophilum]|uniref:Elongation factor Ts n=1 Tax=Dichotomicrobium thermohalophilum TaxID=933063 RepID=A0A397Q529_9HYPH|nr:translation elongation factor Ts [Dichotomicrobium thermohalophilum]RIA56426.1 elongation factor Ts [Dichotomicrobium thermohalophilum]
MAEITAKMVKDLREKTGAGMMDCKKALTETDGDMDAAVDWLRAKGFAKAAKKAGRTAADGLVGVAVEDKKGAVVEVNAETDFVARNDQFQNMVSEIAKLALKAEGDVDKLGAETFPGTDKPVTDYISEMIATIGENMRLRRTGYIEVSDGVVASYVHNAAAPGMGKIGVIVGLESTGDKDKLQALGKQLAMHIAATSPLAVDVDSLDPAVVDRERTILVEQARESGKPENIIEKMVEGRLNKYYQEVVLMKQALVTDPDNTVEAALKAAEEDIGAPVKVVGFERYGLGEGIETEEEDFAAEVAAAASGS